MILMTVVVVVVGGSDTDAGRRVQSGRGGFLVDWRRGLEGRSLA